MRVTGGNLPAPAGNSHEGFIVRVPADFFKPRDVFLSSFKHLDQSNRLLPLKSMVNPSNLNLFHKSLHYHQDDRELAVVTFLVLSIIPSEGKITSKSRSWS